MYSYDWLTVGALVLYYLIIGRNINPYSPPFYPNDSTISLPYIEHQQIPNELLGVIGVVIPIIAIGGVTLKDTRQNYRLLQTCILGFMMSLGIIGVVTDFLKKNIGGLRPDFLARCNPTTSSLQLLTIDQCSSPFGSTVLIEGLKSTPSGHSSIIFGSFTYCSLLLMGQLQVFNYKTSSPKIYFQLACLFPLIIATYLALTRVQDHRHSYFDICFGGILGFSVSFAVYHHYFNWIWHEKSHFIYETESTSLPI